MPVNGLGHSVFKTMLASMSVGVYWRLCFRCGGTSLSPAHGRVNQVTSQENQDSAYSEISRGSCWRGPAHAYQVVLQTSDTRDPALEMLHELKPQVPSGRLKSLRMWEKKVGCKTSYPVYPPDRPNQEMRRQTDQGEDAWRHQLWYGRNHRQY